ncbi:MAG: hypothetical protein J5507_02295 [Clostridia bacterium]|nr:hypothetical protein [Clostridia bacterium]
MENAAKALLIAGGILIAIMTLSLVVYAATATKRIEQAQYEKLEAEKLAKFNMEFEAYNKRRLYGLDVITVINKAIEHNTKMEASDINNPYYINIIFKTREDLKNEIYTFTYNIETKEKTKEEYGIEKDKEGRWNSVDKNKVVIEKNVEYNLGTMKANNFVFNSDIKKIFQNGYIEDDTYSINDYKNNTITTYTLYSALTNFKRAVFSCTTFNNINEYGKLIDETVSGVKYDNQTGRIKELIFVQLPY